MSALLVLFDNKYVENVSIHDHKCNIPKCNSTCMPSTQSVTYRCTDAPFTGVVKNFRTSAKNSGHGVNLRTFQDNF